MKVIKAAGAMWVVLLASCATVPVQGEALECSACRTIWIRLYPSSGAPGVYRLIHGEKTRPCENCQQLAMACFQTGKAPKKCPECGGVFTMRPVNVTP